MEVESVVVIHPKKPAKFSLWPPLILAVVCLVVWQWYGIIYLHWSGAVTRFTTAVIPVPAAIVGGEAISYHDVLKRTDTLAWLSGSAARQEELFAQALQVLIDQRAIEQLARRYEVKITNEDVQVVLAALRGELADKEFEEKIRTELNMSRRVFERIVVEPLALAQKLKAVVGVNNQTLKEVVDDFLAASEIVYLVQNIEA